MAKYIPIFLLVLSSCLYGGSQDFALSTLSRVEFRWKYQELADRSSGNIFILRGDDVFDWIKKWRIALRIDLPYVRLRSYENISFEGEFGEIQESPTPFQKIQQGIADTLTQILFIRSIDEWTFGFGMQIVFPTAAHIDLGTGKYLALPTFGIKKTLDKVMDGFWAGLLLRYASDFAGQKKRPHLSDIIIEPNINVNITNEFFLYFDPDIIYNFMNHQWFVPINVQLGKKFGEHLLFAIRYSKALVKKNPVFEQEFFLRLGYTF